MKTLLTRHFTLEEMTTTTDKELKEKNLADGRKFLYELSKTANLLEAVRALLKCPLVITSGFRCKELNERIGGSATSQHCKGEAADFIPTRMPAREACILIAQSPIQYGQLILELRGQGRIIHISRGDKRENLYSPKAGVYETVPLF